MTQCVYCHKETLWKKVDSAWVMYEFVEDSQGEKIATQRHNPKCPILLQRKAESVCCFCMFDRGVSPLQIIKMEYRTCLAHLNGQKFVFDGHEWPANQDSIIKIVATMKRRAKQAKKAEGMAKLVVDM